MDKQMSRAQIASARSVAKTLRVSRRSILYFARTILLLLILALLCAGAFISAARLSNTYILVSEGMTLRAESMLKKIDDPDLLMYFTSDCINGDAALRAQSMAPYGDFSITGYEYDMIVDKMHVFPWQSSLYVEVTERITSIKATASDSSLSAPAWTPIRYRLRLSYLEGRWYISTVELVEVNPTLSPANTPDMNRSPIPMVTATPEPTPIAVTVP